MVALVLSSRNVLFLVLALSLLESSLAISCWSSARNAVVSNRTAMFCYISLRPLAINYARLEPHRRNHGELKEVNAEVRAADCLDETRWSFKQGIVTWRQKAACTLNFGEITCICASDNCNEDKWKIKEYAKYQVLFTLDAPEHLLQSDIVKCVIGTDGGDLIWDMFILFHIGWFLTFLVLAACLVTTAACCCLAARRKLPHHQSSEDTTTKPDGVASQA